MTASKPKRLTVWRADLEWDDDEIVVKASDYEALEAARAADKARIEELTDLCDRLKQEAQIQAQEARTANATIAEIYRIVSGGKGEPGNWNGAEPVRRRIAELEQDKARLDSGCIMTNERDEFGHEYQCERRGLNLRERIDAALAQQGKEGET